jgi:sulfopyruvate decarboxylase TPP-binding subunit
VEAGTAAALRAVLTTCEITDVVTVPDSTIGAWDAVAIAHGARVVRVCREGEAWGVAMGLHLGGRRPLVLIQCTGLFESGDALRNVVHDWQLPIPAIIGYRSYLNQSTLPGDTCLVFTEPVLTAWQVPWCLVRDDAELAAGGEFLRDHRAAGHASVLLVAEGKA